MREFSVAGIKLHRTANFILEDPPLPLPAMYIRQPGHSRRIVRLRSQHRFELLYGTLKITFDLEVPICHRQMSVREIWRNLKSLVDSLLGLLCMNPMLPEEVIQSCQRQSQTGMCESE